MLTHCVLALNLRNIRHLFRKKCTLLSEHWLIRILWVFFTDKVHKKIFIGIKLFSSKITPHFLKPQISPIYFWFQLQKKITHMLKVRKCIHFNLKNYPRTILSTKVAQKLLRVVMQTFIDSSRPAIYAEPRKVVHSVLNPTFATIQA